MIKQEIERGVFFSPQMHSNFVHRGLSSLHNSRFKKKYKKNPQAISRTKCSTSENLEYSLFSIKGTNRLVSSCMENFGRAGLKANDLEQTLQSSFGVGELQMLYLSLSHRSYSFLFFFLFFGVR